MTWVRFVFWVRRLGDSLTPQRVHRAELIDASGLSVADLDQSFSDIRWINRFLGGTAVIRSELGALVSTAESATLLDLGAGTADIPLSVIKRFRSKGGRITATALDTNQVVIEIAQRHANGNPDLRLLTGDAAKLPFPDGSFDFVTCSLTFHHFSDATAICTLQEMDRVARRALIVNDLRRAFLPAVLIWLLTRLRRMHPLTQHDGPLSVMRSRTLTEYRDLGTLAGFDQVQVRAHPFWRAALVVVKMPA